jgi:hypothetical protein
MAHYAKVLDSKVVNIIVADAEFMRTFVDSTPGTWMETSYNTRGGVHYLPDSDTPSEDQSKALRKNFAGIGYTYDAAKDAFIPPQPFPSWTLNESTCLWEPPVPRPDNADYVWDEQTVSWIIPEQPA